jgi:rfaE bifunctional protein nucleotidyltransferase chain/domain
MKEPRESLSKLIRREDAGELLGRRSRRDMSLALANGCFDMLHIGHVRYLKAAKDTADILLVAINSDASVKKLKGGGRPVVPEKERAEIVASLACVDRVVIFGEETVRELIADVEPDFHCKGGDYREEDVPERDEVIKHGGRVRIVGGEKLRSSTDLIEKVTRR